MTSTMADPIGLRQVVILVLLFRPTAPQDPQTSSPQAASSSAAASGSSAAGSSVSGSSAAGSGSTGATESTTPSTSTVTIPPLPAPNPSWDPVKIEPRTQNGIMSHLFHDEYMMYVHCPKVPCAAGDTVSLMHESGTKINTVAYPCNATHETRIEALGSDLATSYGGGYVYCVKNGKPEEAFGAIEIPYMLCSDKDYCLGFDPQDGRYTGDPPGSWTPEPIYCIRTAVRLGQTVPSQLESKTRTGPLTVAECKAGWEKTTYAAKYKQDPCDSLHARTALATEAGRTELPFLVTQFDRIVYFGETFRHVLGYTGNESRIKVCTPFRIASTKRFYSHVDFFWAVCPSDQTCTNQYMTCQILEHRELQVEINVTCPVTEINMENLQKPYPNTETLGITCVWTCEDNQETATISNTMVVIARDITSNVDQPSYNYLHQRQCQNQLAENARATRGPDIHKFTYSYVYLPKTRDPREAPAPYVCYIRVEFKSCTPHMLLAYEIYSNEISFNKATPPPPPETAAPPPNCPPPPLPGTPPPNIRDPTANFAAVTCEMRGSLAVMLTMAAMIPRFA